MYRSVNWDLQDCSISNPNETLNMSCSCENPMKMLNHVEPLNTTISRFGPTWHCLVGRHFASHARASRGDQTHRLQADLLRKILFSQFAYNLHRIASYCMLPCKSLKYSRSSHQHYGLWMLSRHSVCLDNPDFRSVHLRSRTNTSAIATWLGTTAPSVVLGIYLRMNHACPTNINQWCSCEATSTSDKWVWSPTCAAMLR